MPRSLDAIVTDRVRARVGRERLDLAADPAAADRLVGEETRRLAEAGVAGVGPDVADESAVGRAALAALTGLGPLQPWYDDPEVEELWVNGPDAVFAARGGQTVATGIRIDEVGIRDLVERMLLRTGRRVDLSTPFVDASLPDGSRLHVAIPEVTRAWSCNIRKFDRRIRDLPALVALGSLPLLAAEFLRMSVLAGCSILVSGATQAGKTTLLGALLAAGRAGERVVSVEETFELDLGARDWVAMQCRQPSLEGTGEVTLRRLVKEALRMRPDRLVVGEVRDAEAFDLLIALNSGLPGASSIHANSAREALAKLCTLPLLAGRNIDSGFVVPTVASCIDLVVHCELRRGRRRVVEILAPSGGTSAAAGAAGAASVGMASVGMASVGAIEATTLFGLVDERLEATGAHPARMAKFLAAGLDPTMLLARGPAS